jgi:phosphate-selective porin
MKHKQHIKLTLLAMLLILMGVKTKAQETTEAPIDTLTRFVGSIADDLAKLKRLKITGYIQPQFQYCDSAGAPSYAGGDFNTSGNAVGSRFMMRRGRVKFTYDFNTVQFVLQPDITEKGIFMRETYLRITDPWYNVISGTVGLLQVPFGFEVSQSSQVRETPERARMIQIIFPVERDLGVFIALMAPKFWKPLYGLRIDAAVMNGSAGVAQEFDTYKDFCGRLSYTRNTENEKISIAVGASYYNGGYRIGNVKDFDYSTMSNGNKGYVYAADTANYERKARRQYLGADFQVSIDWKIGITTIRGEYAQGEQPGTTASSRSAGAPPTKDIYHRMFNGGYFYLIQNVGQSRFQVVLKYDWYDPNTKIAGKDIGIAGTKTNVGDIRFDTYGFGLNYRLNANIKLTAYYDYVINEATSIAAYGKDITDNVTTIRMQYRF